MNRGPFGFVFEKSQTGKPHGFREVIVFRKLRLKNVLKFHRVEERFRKAPFSWGISVDGRPNVEIKLRFRISGLVSSK